MPVAPSCKFIPLTMAFFPNFCRIVSMASCIRLSRSRFSVSSRDVSSSRPKSSNRLSWQYASSFPASLSSFYMDGGQIHPAGQKGRVHDPVKQSRKCLHDLVRGGRGAAQMLRSMGGFGDLAAIPFHGDLPRGFPPSGPGPF